MANPLCHWDLAVNDVAKAKQFYGSVFGWRFDDQKFPGYTIIDTGGDLDGGMMPKPPGSPAAALNSYFEVDDASQTLRTVVEAAMFLDPEQIPIGILQPTKAGMP